MNVSAQPKPEHCPDCGAELKPGSQWCWLCNYKSPPPATSSARGQSLPTTKSNWWALSGFILLAIGFVPACCVAFFVSCLTAIEVGGGGFNEFGSGLAVGAIGALVVAVLLIVLMYMLFRSYHRSTLPPEMRNAR